MATTTRRPTRGIPVTPGQTIQFPPPPVAAVGTSVDPTPFRVWVEKGYSNGGVRAPWAYGTHNLVCLAGPGVHDLKAADLDIENGWLKFEPIPLDQTGGEEQAFVSIFPGRPGFVRLYLPQNTILMWYDSPQRA